MDDPRERASNLDEYRSLLTKGWQLVDVDSTDSEIILTLSRRKETLLLALSSFEAAKLAGFDTIAAKLKLRDILDRLDA